LTAIWQPNPRTWADLAAPYGLADVRFPLRNPRILIPALDRAADPDRLARLTREAENPTCHFQPSGPQTIAPLLAAGPSLVMVRAHHGRDVWDSPPYLRAIIPPVATT
jgi:hypothetical protein